MNNSYNIGGSIYTGLGTLDTGKNNYLFLSNGSNITFLRQTPMKNYEANYGGKFYPIALEDYRWYNILAEDMILNYLASNLTNRYGNLSQEQALGYINSYLSYASRELKNISEYEFNISPEASREDAEKIFIDSCRNLANQIDSVVMSMMKANDKTKVDDIRVEDNNLNLNDIISRLSWYDLNNVQELLKNSDDPTKTTIEYLSNRDDIKYLVSVGYTPIQAIKYVIIDGNKVTLDNEMTNTEENTIEKAKVKVLTHNKKEAAYVDTIILCLFAQLTIFLVLLGVLFLLK